MMTSKELELLAGAAESEEKRSRLISLLPAFVQDDAKEVPTRDLVWLAEICENVE